MRATLLLQAALALLPIHLLPSRSSGPFKPLDTVELPNIEGPIQHLAADVKGQRIFLAATSKNSIEIYDPNKLKHIGTITGLAQPQDVIFEPQTGNLMVSNAADGSLRTYDGKSLKLVDTKLMGGDADRVRITAGARNIFVGWGVGTLTSIDAQTGKRSDIRLKSHPDSFQIDPIGHRLFVNVPGVREIAVVDWRYGVVTESWSMRPCQENAAMALDEANRRIFAVCRRPAKLLVLNMDDGAVIATMSTVSDADDVFYDRERKRVYVVGGEGMVAAYRQKTADEYTNLGRTETVPGARTGLFVPEWNRFFVVARNRPPYAQAEMLSFAVEDDASEKN